MAVEVKVTGSMQKAIGGQKSVEAKGSTVLAVLDDVEK
jgi:hypothetical protein